MDHRDPVDTTNAASPPTKQKDPVCGMDVAPADARYQTQHNGKKYFFCSAGCLAKFQANPEKILSSPPQPMGSGLVSSAGPALVMPTMGKPAVPNAQSPGDPGRDTRAHVGPTYVCPMCPEVRQIGPGPCPICGMALEPRTVTVEEDNPELRDMTRRFWISLALTAPLLAIAMGSMFWPHALMDGISVHRADHAVVTPWSSILPWLELILATPVVLWGGWPFFQRGWASVVNRSTNMFTLIAMGTGVAY